MESSALRWSTNEMDLRRFVESYGTSMPAILLTTDGYMVDEHNEISGDQMYFVYEVSRQQRVIAKTRDTRYVSIPLNSSLTFQQLTRKNKGTGPEMKLVEIVGCGPAGQHVKLAGARSVLCDLGGTDGINEYNAKLDDIELEDTHTENYLMAYTADEDEWVFQVLPVYLPIKVKVAIGMAGTADDAEFEQWKRRIAKKCASFRHREFTLCEEILLLSQPPNDNDYEYVNLRSYARSDTAEQAGDQLGGQVSQSVQSRPKASSKQLSLQQTRPLGAKPVPPAKKWSLLEKSSMQKSGTTEKDVAVESRPDRPNVTQEKKTKQSAGGLLSAISRPPADKQSEQFDDGLIYEVLPNLSVQAEDQTTKSRRVSDDDESLETPPPPQQQAAGPQYAAVQARSKKPPPATKPKTFKRNESAAPSAERLVNSVQPFVEPERSSCGQSPSSIAPAGQTHWKSAREVPADLENLSVEQVAECMELLHLPQLAAYFRSEAVDGKLLVRVIDEDILVTEFNISRFKAMQVVQFVKNGWRPNE